MQRLQAKVAGNSPQNFAFPPEKARCPTSAHAPCLAYSTSCAVPSVGRHYYVIYHHTHGGLLGLLARGCRSVAGRRPPSAIARSRLVGASALSALDCRAPEERTYLEAPPGLSSQTRQEDPSCAVGSAGVSAFAGWLGGGQVAELPSATFGNSSDGKKAATFPDGAAAAQRRRLRGGAAGR